jgi:uncharacterized membrane protein
VSSAAADQPAARLAGSGALGGAFWGLLFGLLFLVSLLGVAIGAAAGALIGRFSGVGIDDDFIERARDEITPGPAALFVLSSAAVRDRVQEPFAGQRAELLFTNLSKTREDTRRTSRGACSRAAGRLTPGRCG